MVKLIFTKKEKESLQYERFHHPHPRVQLKMEVLWLKSQGLKKTQIVQMTGLAPNTVLSYFREYQEGGISKLREFRYPGQKSVLRQHVTSIEADFEKSPPANIKEATARIEKLTGVKRSTTQVREFLIKVGLRRLKVGSVPSKADLDEQEEFKKKKIEPRLKEAKEGKRDVFFMDAVHFVFALYVGYLWSRVRYFVKMPAGRQRLNILGAIHATKRELHLEISEGNINTEVVCKLLRKVAESSQKEKTVFLDNATYQKNEAVEKVAKELGIELLYLPKYSPNLNLIERLWKFVKKKSLYSKYYKEFREMCAAIILCLVRTQTLYKTELQSLLALQFQSFKKVQILA